MLPPMPDAATPDPRPITTARPAARGGWLAGLGIGAVVLMIAGLIIASGRAGPSEASDQNKYHLVVIDGMVAEWPAIDVVNYPSATSPGYHAVMASVARVVPEEARLTVMRVLNAVVGALIPVWCFVVARRFTDGGRAAALSVPVALNSYVLGGSAYLTTDNAGLLLALVAVGVCVGWPVSAWRMMLAGVAATGAVATRQVHVWAAAVPLVALATALPVMRRMAPPALHVYLQGRPRSVRLATVGAGLAWGVPSVVVGVFVAMWGGLVPPSYAALHNGGANLAAFALAFGLAGVIAPLFSLVATPLWRSDAYRSRVAILFAGVALVWAIAVPTTFQMKERALGWLWHGVWYAPAWREHSWLLVGLAPMGGAAVGMMVSTATRRGRGAPALILVVALAGWLAAQSMNTMAWQRYFEPMLLVTLAWLASMGVPSADEEGAWARPKLKTVALIERCWWLGPAALAALQLGVTSLTLLREVLGAAPANF